MRDEAGSLASESSDRAKVTACCSCLDIYKKLKLIN